jgi:hypothetical protein
MAHCPFVDANGRRCNGRIVRVEAYKADLEWAEKPNGSWEFGWFARSHYHVFCSEKGNHSGYISEDDERMKFYLDTLPKEIRSLLNRTGIHGEESER